ncbi:MAG: hypothetical protein BGO01_16580 [Armatimonadetes bacterium 55-13]|nr:hypothetical protein [Armatimonadota bacterium]OJU65473.1 MAG: hypothetical protein BGO01_16580 [Armatimonadetes bacterium 55-13]
MNCRPFLCLASLLAVNLASAQFVAYKYPKVTGNQAYGGALGMDFDVIVPIKITALGIFDSAQDGIKNNIDCILYNRDTKAAVASKAFSPSNMGIGDGSSNFLDLATPVYLPAGFHATIVAQGYGILERNGNSFNPSSTYATSLETGGGLIQFTGKSRNGAFGTFPTTIDFNVAQYGAGNFKFVSALPPVPEPTTLLVLTPALFLIRKRRRA